MRNCKLLLSVMVLCCLTGCIWDDRHISKKKAEEVAEDLIGQDVTYVTSYDYPEEKKRILVFADEVDNEFAIESQLRKRSFQGAEYGRYICHLTDNYASAVMMSHKEEMMAILEKYELVEYIDESLWQEPDITTGDGSVAMSIYLEVPPRPNPVDIQLLERVATAGAELDQLFDLTYDADYRLKAREKGLEFETYAPGGGITIYFNYPDTNYKGEYIERSYLATFDWSMSRDERWTAETLFKDMKKQIDKQVERNAKNEWEMSKKEK